MEACTPMIGLFAQLLAQTTPAPEVVKAGATTTTAVAAGTPGWLVWLLAIAIVVGCYALAQMLCQAWRMKDDVGRMFLFLFATVAGIAILATSYTNIKYGIDLSGGTILHYSIDNERVEKKTFDENDRKAVEKAVIEAIKTDTANKATVEIPANTKNRIRITIPNAAENQITRVNRLLGQQSILPNKAQMGKVESSVTKTSVEYELLPIQVGNMEKMVEGLGKRINPGGQKEIAIRPIGKDQVEIIIPKATQQEIAQIKENIRRSGQLEFRILAEESFEDHQKLVRIANSTRNNLLTNEVVDRSADPPVVLGRWVDIAKDAGIGGAITRIGKTGAVQALVFYDDSLDLKADRRIKVVTGEGMTANKGFDERGNVCVNFNLPSVSANNFSQLTRRYTQPGLPTKANLGIVLDNELSSAPNLNTAITGGSGQITGIGSERDVEATITVLNSGALPSYLSKIPNQEEQISAQLGEDTIRSGGLAMVIATVAILIFMLLYYGYCGFIADICVILNIVLVVALMIPLQAVFTLAGLAGLVLSVGMAVDANVLIFERMREEVQRGASLKMAIRNGFSRAMSTVVDSNLTTLVSGIVLFAIGTEQLKGFATTLILGLILNLFTAVYCARLLFDVSEKNGWFTKLRMMRMIGETKFDFVKPVKACVFASLLVIVGGLALAAIKGNQFFDIDFTGGYTLQVTFKDTAENSKLGVGDIREMLKGKLDDVEVSEVFNADGVKNKKFKIVSSLTRPADASADADSDTMSEKTFNDAKEKIKDVFKGRLENYQVKVGTAEAYKDPNASATKLESPAVGPKIETPKADSTKSDAGKETPKTTEPAKPAETTKDAPKTDPGKSDSGKSDAPKAEEPKVETPKVEEPKVETPKVDAPKTETPKADDAGKQSVRLTPAIQLIAALNQPATALQMLQAGLLQAEAGKDTTKEPAADKADAGKADAAKADPAKSTEPKPVEPKTETAKPEEPKAGASTPMEPATPVAPVTPPAMSIPGIPALDSAIGSGATYKSQSNLVFFTQGVEGGKGQTPTAVSKEQLEDMLKKLLVDLKSTATLQDFDFIHPEGNMSLSAVSDKWLLVSNLAPAELQPIVDQIKATFESQPVFSQISRVGTSVGDSAKGKAIAALLVSMVAIVLYVWFRFQNVVFGFAAVIALVHDVLVTIGFLALSHYIAPYFGWALVNPFKISLEVVAALLTIIGFSINDTIVIFDRIRELRGKSPDITPDMINKAVNQTLGRTILTSGTVLIVTLILYIFGGEEIHPFSYAMLIGLISGTYSTVFIAAPIVLWFRSRERVETPVARQVAAAKK